jgi:hypothetical protein
MTRRRRSGSRYRTTSKLSSKKLFSLLLDRPHTRVTRAIARQNRGRR